MLGAAWATATASGVGNGRRQGPSKGPRESVSPVTGSIGGRERIGTLAPPRKAKNQHIGPTLLT